MFDIIFKKVQEDRYIVDKNSTIFSILFQHPIYKTLYIQKRVRISYKDYVRTFYPLLADKGETISIIQINEQLKKKVEYIDYYDKPLFIDKIDDFLL